MLRFLILLAFTTLSSCYKKAEECSINTNEQLAYNTNNLYENVFLGEEPSYNVKFSEEKLDKNSYDFNIDITLKGGAHFVSPHSIINYKGRFTMVIPKNDHIIVNSDIIEIPKTKEEFDPHPFVNGKINWVKVNTKYKQRLKVTTKKDFVIYGFIQFVIEPKCTLEKVPFVMEYKNGELKIFSDKC